MNDYTPDTDHVRDLWRAGRQMQLGLSIYLDGERTEGEFDRWLAEVERAAAEKGWDERGRARADYSKGHDEDCTGWEDCRCARYPNPYRKEQ